jgi:nucleoside-diphosphate-sugar epimerase
MKVLVTGGSGFIGRHALGQLLARGHEVHATTTQARPAAGGIHWHGVDLLAPGRAAALVRQVAPTHLLHLAWTTQPGRYWSALDNLDWVRASLDMIQAFVQIGGQRLVAAGTCAEYDWSGSSVCVEASTPLLPATLYGNAKHALQTLQTAWSRQTGFSSAWGRIFSLYGPNEYPQRLIASVITRLLAGQSAGCTHPALVRDYLHAADVASAFVAVLHSDIQGPLNIGSGQGVALGEIVTEIAHHLGASERVSLPVGPTGSSEPPTLIADVQRLRSIGWTPRFDLSAGLSDTIAWWRAQPPGIA